MTALTGVKGGRQKGVRSGDVQEQSLKSKLGKKLISSAQSLRPIFSPPLLLSSSCDKRISIGLPASSRLPNYPPIVPETGQEPLSTLLMTSKSSEVDPELCHAVKLPSFSSIDYTATEERYDSNGRHLALGLFLWFSACCRMYKVGETATPMTC